MIEEGSFTVTNEKDQELARVGKGSCFGELALLRQVALRTSALKAWTLGAFQQAGCCHCHAQEGLQPKGPSVAWGAGAATCRLGASVMTQPAKRLLPHMRLRPQ